MPTYHETARAITLRQNEVAPGLGTVFNRMRGYVRSSRRRGGRRHRGVLGTAVERLYDVGVAGLHRLLFEQGDCTAPGW